jgi:Amt family ammonium transporter
MSTITDAQFEALAQGLNKAWIIICGSVIFSMQVGFALLEAGGVRRKNAHVVWQKLLINCLVTTFGWWLCGYAIAFGGSESRFVGGKTFFAGDNWEGAHEELVTQYGHWVFQVGIACVVVAITGGSISERVTLKATAIHTFIMNAFIYPFAIAWTWGGGWLSEHFDYHDFTGSAMVHCTGAFAGLAGLLVVGPRYNKNGNFKKVLKDPEVGTERGNEYKSDVPAVISTMDDLTNFRRKIVEDEFEEYGLTNPTYTLMGGLLLWFQFIFFNAGSSIVMDSEEAWLSAEKAAANTFLGGLGAGPIAMLIKPYIINGSTKFKRKLRDDAATLCNAVLGGMVANGAGMDTYEPWEAIVVGIIAGIGYCLACKVFEHFHLDDALEAWQLHGMCGSIGALCPAFFYHEGGIYHGNPTKGKIFGNQLFSWFIISIWSFSISLLVFLILKYAKILRVDLKTEIIGYDFIDYAENIRLVGDGNLEQDKGERSSYSELTRKTTD